MIEVGSVDVHISLLWRHFGEIEASINLGPLLEVRQILVTEIVSIAYRIDDKVTRHTCESGISCL